MKARRAHTEGFRSFVLCGANAYFSFCFVRYGFLRTR